MAALAARRKKSEKLDSSIWSKKRGYGCQDEKKSKCVVSENKEKPG